MGELIHNMDNNIKKCMFVFMFAFAILITSGNVCKAKGAMAPALKVKGTGIVNSRGKNVTLKGISTHGIAWFPQYVNKSCFKSFKKMGANTVRLAFYSDPGSGYSVSDYGIVEKGVDAATELGMYVIVDWHILSDGNPDTHSAEAVKFFEHFASKYRDNTNIIFEICNEPNGAVTWKDDIKPYAKKMIPVIRKYNKKAIIIVGTPTWSQDVDVVSNDPIEGYKNIMYAFHFYAATHKEWLRDKLDTAVKRGLPVIVSEFSICDASGNGSIDKKEGARWMRYLKKHKIGRIAWSVCNKNESASLIRSECNLTGGFKKNNLSDTGKWIVNNW